MAVAVANILAGAGTLSVGGTDVGGTMNGVTMRHETDWIDVAVDQHKGKVKKISSQVRLFLATTIAETSLANLKSAIHEGVSLTASTLSINATSVGEVQLIFVGAGPNSSARTATFPKCVGLGNISVPWKRDNLNVIDVEFEVIMDVSTGGFGAIVDV